MAMTGEQLLLELKKNPGRVCLIPSGETQADVVESLVRDTGRDAVSVWRFVADALPIDQASLEGELEGHRLLIDIDALFWPEMGIDPLRLLRRLSRKAPVIAAWPGRIDGEVARYSEPGRADHYEATLTDALIVLAADNEPGSWTVRRIT
jgi:hypothetical protein